MDEMELDIPFVRQPLLHFNDLLKISTMRKRIATGLEQQSFTSNIETSPQKSNVRQGNRGD